MGKNVYKYYNGFITYVYQGEASVENGKVVIDTMELDAEKYNL